MKTGDQTRSVTRTIIWGIISLAAYLLIFLNQEVVTKYFTQGGFFALVVIITAIAFSVIHGAFANYLLEALGIHAIQKEKGGH